MRARLVAALLLLGAAAVRAQGVDAHLLAGARAFRAQQYDTALAEFRKVEQASGAPDLPLYLGPTLYKLGRYDEARQVLGRAHRNGSADAVAEYYLGLSWYRLGLVRLARGVFFALDAREAGPKLAEGAARFVADIDARAGAATATLPLLSAAETLEHSLPLVALDDAEEAFLRAAAGSPERARAAALVARLGPPSDPIVRQAAAEPAPVHP
jgi:tetratricopeptide (TPR) repeat protein